MTRMSMHHDTKMSSTDIEDEDWLEAEIQRELEAIADDTGVDDNCNNKDNLVLRHDSASDQEPDTTMEMVPVMDAYIHCIQSQTARLQEELQECDKLLQHTDIIVSTPRPHQDDLVNLAQERGMDAETLKREVMEVLDREDMEDEHLKLESVNNDYEETTELQLATVLKTEAETQVLDHRDCQKNSDNQTTFLTGVGEQNMTEEEEYLQLKRKFLGPEPEEADEEHGSETGEGGDEVLKDQDDNDDSPRKLTLKPGQGTIMSMVDPEALERRVMREVLEWEVKWMKQNDQKQQELAAIVKEEQEKQEEARRKWENRQHLMEREQKVLQEIQQAKEEELRKEADVLQRQIEKSIDQYEVEIDQLTQSVRIESEALLQVKEDQEKNQDEKRQLAALKIQAMYRGYRVYKEKGLEVQAHLEEWKQKKMEARIKALDESRRKKEEAKRKKEDDERRRKEAEERRKEEEKRRKEEEILKREEEQKRKEEEKRLKEEEEKLKHEEEEQKRLEEKHKKEEAEQRKREQEAKRIEEERRRKELENERLQKVKEEKMIRDQKEEEERLKKDEEEKKRREQIEEQERSKREKEEKRMREQKESEAKLKEELRLKEEQEKERMEQEAAQKKAEEEKLKQLGNGTPRSPAPPEGRPKTPRKKMNDLRRSAMSPMANGVRSPPSSAGSERSHPITEKTPHQQLSSQPSSSPPVEPATSPPAHSRLRTPRSARSDASLILPEVIEKTRLEWMQKCRPWSKTEREMKIKRPSSNRKPLRRPISAKNQSEISETLVLQAAGATSLQQVTTVELHDLPGCTLKTLANCPRLRTLTINRCQVVTTEGIAECKQLLYLDMQHNVLETISLRDLEKLVYLDVSHNNLTSVHGLEGCTSLRFLCAAGNKLTRIGGLQGLNSLHTLDLSHNQLITTKGLGAAPTLQDVDLSHNHLPSIDDIEPLGLLQVLKAAGNNIIQLPVLANHVLLRHLVMDDNSLCSVRSLSLSWLPLLEQVSMAQNSLTTIDDLSSCVLMQNLNISHNQILDAESMIPGLQSCKHLSFLKTEGNPAYEEADFRSTVVDALPWLQRLDNYNPPCPTEALSITDFERMCTEQLAVWEKLTKHYSDVLRDISSPPDLTSVHTRYFTTSHSLAIEHRYSHEYGESTTLSNFNENLMFDLARKPGGADDGQIQQSHADTSQMKNKFELALQANGPKSAELNGSLHAPSESDVDVKPDAMRKSQVRGSHNRMTGISKGLRQQDKTRNPIHNAAATLIQAWWRGQQVRRDIAEHSRLWNAATTIQALWRGYFTRKVLQEMGYFLGVSKNKSLHRAATIIQAAWRGHRVRKRIQYALNYARLSFDEDDLDEDLDFTEVDLSAFDFNEADLEKGWTPPETPQLPANHAVLGRPSSSQHQTAQAKAAFDAAFNVPQQPFPLVNRPPHPPQLPRQAWRNVDSPLSDAGPRPPLPPLSRLSDHSATETHRTDQMTTRTHRSKKEEQLTEEWGFKDQRTAELMMQRAKKLKYNSARKKKLSQLDPKQRLALFRKLEETANVPAVQAPIKKMLPRKEYFQAREEEVAQKAVEKQREQVNHHMRTFEWVHTQVGNYPPPASSRINQGLTEAAQYNSEGNLPQMDAHVIAGARPHLTGSPMSLEIQSLDSVSTAGDLHRRKVSSGGDPASRLPPIKVSSAPSAQAKGERMSFRNPKAPPTLESVGWGSGKKRAARR